MLKLLSVLVLEVFILLHISEARQGVGKSAVLEYEELDSERHVIYKRSNQSKTKGHGKDTHSDECSHGRPGTCEKCLENKKCMWCNSDKTCTLYPLKHIVPNDKDCTANTEGTWSQVKWGVCSVDFKIVAITVATASCVLLILLCCCAVKFCRCAADCLYYSFCCCCCSHDSNGKKEERSLKRIERQLERQARRQELMLKFGLQTNAPYGTTKGYSQFEDTPI